MKNRTPLSRSLLPIDRPGKVTPDAWRVSAARLSLTIGIAKTAYVYGVHKATVSKWRKQTLRVAA